MRRQSSDDLRQLVERCRQGDNDAWSSLVHRFESLVYSIPKKHGLNAEDCADVFQVTFHTLLRNLDRIEAEAGLPSWLSVTATRESLRVLRISGRYESSEDLGLSLDEIVADEDATAEREAIATERNQALQAAVRTLPQKCRELISRLYLEGDVPYTEVARELKIPIGSIGPTRARCLEKLRQILTKDGFFE